MTTGKCKFEGCDNDIRHRELEICYTCYSGLRYWRGRSMAAKRARQQQVIRLNARMEYMIVGGKMPKPKAKAKAKQET